MDANAIRKPLTDELISQFNYYNFEITGFAKEFIDTIVQDVIDLIEEAYEEDLLDEEYYGDAIEEFELSDTACYAIVNRAIKEDNSHFEDITGIYGLPMTPSGCLQAEWMYNILPDILSFIIDFVEKANE